MNPCISLKIPKDMPMFDFFNLIDDELASRQQGANDKTHHEQYQRVRNEIKAGIALIVELTNEKAFNERPNHILNGAIHNIIQQFDNEIETFNKSEFAKLFHSHLNKACVADSIGILRESKMILIKMQEAMGRFEITRT